MNMTDMNSQSVIQNRGGSFGPADLEMPVKVESRILDFTYQNGHRVLKNVNMKIRDKTVTAFIGPSGCGKSTLLRTFNRMYDLYPGQKVEGEILLDGKNILSKDVDLNNLRAKVGMVFQKPTPFPMSIYENIAFGIRLYEKISKSEMNDRVEAALTEAALWTEVKDKINQSGLGLSGGQQQRLCIARAIAVKPSVLLLDEPASALDPISTAKIEELIESLRSQYCIAIVTHNMQQARVLRSTPPSCISASWSNSTRLTSSSAHRASSARATTSPAASAEWTIFGTFTFLPAGCLEATRRFSFGGGCCGEGRAPSVSPLVGEMAAARGGLCRAR